MPHTTYGMLKAIRSHEIDSPNVEIARKSGRPTACNLCHVDRTLDWTAQYLTEWYGHPSHDLSLEERSVSSALMLLLRGDAGQRAIAAWHFGWEPALNAAGAEWSAPFLARLLDDPYATVRYIAHRSLTRQPGFEDFDYDYVGPPHERAQAVERALDAWATELTLAPDVNPDQLRPLLLRPDGSVYEAAVRDLLRRRDDRPYYLAE
jgi:hypothetical protein